MKKQLLSEEFARMQKLAGIISEIKIEPGVKSEYDFIDSESKKVNSLEDIPALIAKLNKALFVDQNIRTLYDTSVRGDIADILMNNLGDILPEDILDRLSDDATGAIEAIENNDPSFFTEYGEYDDDY
jgi:hypothetical protein